MQAGNLDTRITILRRVEAQDPVYGSFAATWEQLATVWAEVQDMLPSRAERLVEGVEIARRPCRVRIRFRPDLDSSMRLQIGQRQLRIVGGPAELGRREGLELLAEELTTEGSEA